MNKLTGIYEIRCKVSNKKYIGGTATSFHKRWAVHRSLLNNNIHDNIHLQRAWNKYGADNFDFIIMLLCEPEHCLYYEQLFLDKYFDNCVNCYNISKIAGASMTGRKHSQESKEKNKRSHKGKIVSDKTRQKLSKLFSNECNPMFGRKGKLAPNYGKIPSNEIREKISRANKGRKHSQETIEKMSNMKIGKYNGVNNPNHKLTVIEVCEIREKYNKVKITQTKLAKEYNVDRRTIYRIINNETWNT